ncbi:MAG TPA: class I SAM-dependent methyltransferase, partial [Leptospiraceae bacterium]|nr:class I SAM-dependent methyltransferase [Leptospiraceae bacterium]
DFPLRAKLLKSRGSFKSIFDYRRWFNISWYHFKSRLLKGSTSSMVLYAFK